MAKSNKEESSNPLTDSLLWLMEATRGLPRAISVRHDEASNTLTIKRFEGSRVVDERVVKGIREASKVIADLDKTLILK